MEKRDTLELLLAAALLGGALYFLFYTERGRRLREQLVHSATEKLDDWLAALEKELEEAENDLDEQVKHS